MTASLDAPSKPSRTLNLVLTVAHPRARHKGRPEPVIPVYRPVTFDGDLLTVAGLSMLGRNLTRQLCPLLFTPEISFGHDQATDLAIDDATAQQLFPEWRFDHLSSRSTDRWKPSDILGMSLVRSLCLITPGWCDALGRGSVRAGLDVSDPHIAVLGLSFKRSLHPHRLLPAN